MSCCELCNQNIAPHPETGNKLGPSTEQNYKLQKTSGLPQIIQHLEDTFSITEARSAYDTFNTSKPKNVEFKQILWMLPNGKAYLTQPNKNFHKAIKTKISKNQMCFDPKSTNTLEGATISLQYIKDELDGKTTETATGADYANLNFMFVELMKPIDKASQLQTIYYFQVKLDLKNVKRTISFRTHVFCKSYSSKLLQPSAVFFDSQSKVLQCLFENPSLTIGKLMTTKDWNFRATLEIVDTRMYLYYKEKMFKYREDYFFDEIVPPELSYTLQQAREDKASSLETDNQDLDLIWETRFLNFANEGMYKKESEVKMIYEFAYEKWKAKNKELIDNIWEEILSKKNNFEDKLRNFERVQFRDRVQKICKQWFELVYNAKNGFQSWNIAEVTKFKQALKTDKKKIYENASKYKELNKLGQMLLGDIRFEKYLEYIKENTQATSDLKTLMKASLGEANKAYEDFLKNEELEKEFAKLWKFYINNYLAYIINKDLIQQYLFRPEKDPEIYWPKENSGLPVKPITESKFLELDEDNKQKYYMDPCYEFFYRGVLVIDSDEKSKQKLSGQYQKPKPKEQKAKYVFVDTKAVTVHKNSQTPSAYNETEFYLATKLSPVAEVIKVLENRKDMIKFSKRVLQSINKMQEKEKMNSTESSKTKSMEISNTRRSQSSSTGLTSGRPTTRSQTQSRYSRYAQKR